jgi:hypothetical protein
MPTKAFFTKANASEYARKGNAIRWHSLPKPEPQPATSLPEPVRIAQDDFTQRKLARVRVQIERVEDLLTAATEPQAVDRYAAALARLYEIERVLAGRPLPGSRRPSAEPKSSAADAGAWIVDIPPATTQPITQGQTNTSESSGVIRGDLGSVVKPVVCNQLQSDIKSLSKTELCNQLQTNFEQPIGFPAKPLGWEYDDPAATSGPDPIAQVDRLPGDVTP